MVKVMLLVTVMTILMLVVAFTGYSTSSRIAFRMVDTYEGYSKPALEMSKALSISSESKSILVNMADERDRSLLDALENELMANRKAVIGILSAIDRDRLSDEGRRIFEHLRELGPRYRGAQDEAVETAKSGTGVSGLRGRLLQGGDIAELEAEYIEDIQKMADDLVKSADDVNAQAEGFARRRALMTAITSAAAVLFGILLSVLISRAVTVPINRIMDSIGLFSKGDLSAEFPTSGKDEIGVMGRELMDMSGSLTRIIGSVKEASGRIHETSSDFMNMAEETNVSVEEFRSGVDETGESLAALAAAGAEVNASVQEVAAGAQATAEKGTDIARRVDDAMQAGENGMSSVRRAVEGINGVVDNASATARSVQELGERTRQIQNFVTQIGGIADQTNLLALNAAIEAARAGEAGRGFAVVAEEVRKLAEESNLAAKNIEDLAKTIMGELDIVVNMSLDNAKASEAAKGLSSDTENIISNMIAYLKEIAGATQDLAAVSQEQAASSEEISEAVQNISLKVQNAADKGERMREQIGHVAGTVVQIKSKAGGLQNLVADLENILSFFRMKEEGAGRLSLRA
jgi:methyl-accepting chemotaxis protein